MISEDELSIEMAGVEYNGLRALYAYDHRYPQGVVPTETGLLVFRLGGWAVKYRFTHPAVEHDAALLEIEEFVRSLTWPELD